MGDRCYMEVRCLPKDAHLFEDLGFEITIRDEKFVFLVDDDANYAHFDEMPNVHYFAYNTAGSNYPQSVYVCDGKITVELDCFNNNHIVKSYIDLSKDLKEVDVFDLDIFISIYKELKTLGIV